MDYTVIEKTQSKPKQARRLGTLQASWAKIKQATEEEQKTPEILAENVEQGPNGELVIYRPAERRFDLWSWNPPPERKPSNSSGPAVYFRGGYGGKNDSQALGSLSKNDSQTGNGVGPSNATTDRKSNSDRLHHVQQVKVADKILAFKVLAEPPSLVYVFERTTFRDEQEHVLRIHGGGTFVLSESMKSPFSVKTSGDLVAVGSADGQVQLVRASNGSLEATGLYRATCHDGQPIFDVRGRWLVYCPAPTEGQESPSLKKTAVKLPPPGPLLNRVVSSISASALNKLYSLSEQTSKKVKGYWAGEKESKETLKATAAAVGHSLYSSATKFRDGNRKMVKIVDIHTEQVLAYFRPPGGVSVVSLSPYDLQLVHASSKGDNLFLWDLHKLSREVSLMGKFARGVTSARILGVRWLVSSEVSANSVNSGFACATAKSGSVHWFSINYLYGAAEPLDAWVLPSVGAEKLLRIPENADSPEQLGFLDRDGKIRLVGPASGTQQEHYALYSTPLTPKVPVTKGELHFDEKLQVQKPQSDTPLEQTEIETCEPWLKMITNRNVEFARFDFQGDDADEILKKLEKIGQTIPATPLDFGAVAQNAPDHEGLIIEEAVE